jgi:hypothetical protein
VFLFCRAMSTETVCAVCCEYSSDLLKGLIGGGVTHTLYANVRHKDTTKLTVCSARNQLMHRPGLEMWGPPFGRLEW